MTREEAIRILGHWRVRLALGEKARDDQQELKERTELYNAIDYVLPTLEQPASAWIRTSERVPKAEDGIEGADGDYSVVAITKYAHGYFPEVKAACDVEGRSKYYPYWLPLPPLPEVE